MAAPFTAPRTRLNARLTAHRNVAFAEETMRTMLDNMSDGVMLFDKNMRWQFTNPASLEVVADCSDCRGELRFRSASVARPRRLPSLAVIVVPPHRRGAG